MFHADVYVLAVGVCVYRDPSSGRPSSYSSSTSQPSLCRDVEPQVGSLLLLGREQNYGPQLRIDIMLCYV